MFVFRNYTIENLFPNEFRFSGYDDISFVPEDEKELVWFYQAPINFDSSVKASSVESFNDKLKYLTTQLKGDQTLLICSLIDPFPISIVDADCSVKDAIFSFNKEAERLAAEDPRISFLNVADYFDRFPAGDLISWRFYFISQMIFAPSVASGFSAWFNHRVSHIRGERKKCLVLDLDNTLWGGVLGEDGIDGIKIGGDYPGNAFLYFQQALIELSKTGVILALCSKNNEADVFELWEKNPFVKLNKEYVSAYRINWNNKADNIRELAKELNIGLDSMVFVDDNPTERELILQQLPMVSVPEFPTKPYLLPAFFKKLVEDYFQTPSLTKEDLKKTAQYKANAARAEESRRFTDLSEFIKSLEIKIEVTAGDSFNIPRIAQMTQKTNQFNLTTKRYSETDVWEFVNDGGFVACASVGDKFGDNGITAAFIANREGETATIDSYLLSCRILGKGIEFAILTSLFNSLHSSGINTVFADYIPTAKNAQVADFYDRAGFELLSTDETGTKHYRKNLTEILPISDSYEFRKTL